MSPQPTNVERAIIHVDMDAFYASVEQSDDPSLRGKPVIVGHGSSRGVVAAASYEARQFGVHSAMAMVTAMRKCPDAAILRPRMERYVEISEQVFDVFRKYTPLVEGLSLDEAFLDVTGSQLVFGNAVEIARSIRKEIADVTGLTASAGIAPNKFVAKIASDMDKPNGLVVVAKESISAFLAPLPIERMWGVGKKSVGIFHTAGIRTFSDLTARTDAELLHLLGERGPAFRALAFGIDERPVVPERNAKSIGAETTFSKDLDSLEAIETHLLRQCERVARRLEATGLWATTIALKLKDTRHKTKTRQRRVDPIRDVDSIFDVTRTLLTELGVTKGARLVGVSASAFVDQVPGLLFDENNRKKRERLQTVTAELERRFGSHQVTRARLLKSEDTM